MAIDNQEFEVGQFCLAVPIKDFMGNTVTAISIAGPEFRINNRTIGFLSHLKLIVNKISEYCDL
ncbi:DNA-binding IclR family transcriptional regulator [Neobacillus niacini]|uniref:IclR family transcriptional regulator domain-containing protein n=1 Tax=Neobacillus niacini TaxID=86668 RepID=UPI002784D0E4|nr:IclR family transcriptional regulator C-terminal domain-containing protein [Neobacillus niacini]MDQ1003528.1 DNA-binding IclR family transcriptional regulator [Neobacillus niacini]